MVQAVAYVAAHQRQHGQSPLVLVHGQHAPLYTLGKATLPAHAQQAQATGLPCHTVERGGSVTYHGPGQWVAYPIAYSRQPKTVLHQVLQAAKHALEPLGLTHHWVEGPTGLWVQTPTQAAPQKVAALGMAFRQWVSYHGLSVNVTNPLEAYDAISPCGFAPHSVTRLVDLALVSPPLQLLGWVQQQGLLALQQALAPAVGEEPPALPLCLPLAEAAVLFCKGV
jgi:lipoyl(octanoyl) transferase